MKIKIQLSSEFFTEEESDWFHDNPKEIVWDYPVLPREDDRFDDDFANNLYNKYDFMEVDEGLTWYVSCIDWAIRYNDIIPSLCLIGR